MLDTRMLRRDDRLAGVAAATIGYGNTLLHVANGRTHLVATELPVTQASLEAAIATTRATDLPATRALLNLVDTSNPGTTLDAITNTGPKAITDATTAALTEISERRRHVK